MCMTSSERIACPQNETSREVSHTSSPALALNHWRLVSTSVTSAIGTENMVRAMRVSRLKRSSGPVSRRLSEWRVAILPSSSGGAGGGCIRWVPELNLSCGPLKQQTVCQKNKPHRGRFPCAIAQDFPLHHPCNFFYRKSERHRRTLGLT